MKLQNLLVNRYKWQNNTIETIKKKLLLKPTIVSISHTKDSEKIVVIYGKPQIGKTTLILYLMGVSSKHYKRVYNILRADIPRGNSSTSTAIIYQITDNQQFGMCFSDITAISKEDVKFYSDEDFKVALKEVRYNVENGSQSDDILYIYIPNECVDEEALNFSNINIIDMPGDGSRNEKENFHVQVLLKKYLTMATVNIIVCKANEIQSLETQSFEHCPNWYCLSNKHIVVTTNSFSQGSVKSYFNCPKNKRKINFYEYVKNLYSNELKKVFPKEYNVEIYPTDIGDSLDRLIKNELRETTDQNEVAEASKKMANEIRKAIQSRRGNELKSIIIDLKQIVNNYTTGIILEYQNTMINIKDNIDSLKNSIDKNKVIVKQVETEINECSEQIKKYLQICSYNSTSSFSKDVEDAIEALIKSKSTFWGNFNDRNEDVRNAITEQLKLFTQQAIDCANKRCDNEYTLFANCDDFIRDITDFLSFQQHLWNSMYQDGLFKGKIDISDCITLVHKKMNLYAKEVNKRINDTIYSHYMGLVKEYQTSFDMMNALINQKECDLSLYNKRLDVYHSKQCELEKNIEKIKEIQQNDNRLLEDYIKEAKNQFNFQKKEICSAINLAENQPEVKMLYIIYLGILEKDFRRITGEVDGKK